MKRGAKGTRAMIQRLSTSGSPSVQRKPIPRPLHGHLPIIVSRLSHAQQEARLDCSTSHHAAQREQQVPPPSCSPSSVGTRPRSICRRPSFTPLTVISPIGADPPCEIRGSFRVGVIYSAERRYPPGMAGRKPDPRSSRLQGTGSISGADGAVQGDVLEIGTAEMAAGQDEIMFAHHFVVGALKVLASF